MEALGKQRRERLGEKGKRKKGKDENWNGWKSKFKATGKSRADAKTGLTKGKREAY